MILSGTEKHVIVLQPRPKKKPAIQANLDPEWGPSRVYVPQPFAPVIPGTDCCSEHSQ